jgi:transcription elongation factor Elf1
MARASQRQTSVSLGGSMSCPKCSHETKVIGTEKNKRIFYCERCELVINEKKLEDKVEMS